MPQEATTAASFIDQVRGTTSEFASLVYLAAALTNRVKDTKSAAAPSEDQRQTINRLRTRIAELSRYSEKKMQRAAVSLSQISKALEGAKANTELANRFAPVRKVLQEQIDHSRGTLQVGLRTVSDLDGLIGKPAAAPAAPAAKAPRKRPPAKKAAAPRATGAAKKAARKTAARKAKGKSTASGESTTAG
jgi:hypothetical protein